MSRHRLLAALCGTALLTLPVHGIGRPSGWDDRTHGRSAEPDYARVFATDQVTRLDIDISTADWDIVIADMTAMAGAFGAQRQQPSQPTQPVQPGQPAQPGQPTPGGGPGGFTPTADAIAACAGRVVADACTVNAVVGRCVQTNPTTLACLPQFTGGPGGAGPIGGGGAAAGGGRGANGADDVDIFPSTPVYVPADIRFEGTVFHHVGFRLKGNSSLSNAWRAGTEKLPFRLNFDELEDRYPEIRDQTFFGFPNLAFTSNSTDASFLRHRVATDLFREAGVPAPRTAYIRVYLNRGGASTYLGVYTMTEIPDEPMLDRMFGTSAGNLYKPVGTGGRWLQFFELSFPKKTNEAFEDWTDIQGAIEALNAPRTNAAAWRARLEARFEVNGFLRWLALNTIIGNFDAYGGLSAHNYYLYGSPRHRDRLFWIAWDHDLSFNGGGLGGGGLNSGVTTAGGLDLFLDSTNATWPLIRFLLDDPVYRTAYRQHVNELLTSVFEPSKVITQLRTEHARLAPYVIGTESDGTQFTTALTSLEAYVRGRHAAALTALAVSR